MLRLIAILSLLYESSSLSPNSIQILKPRGSAGKKSSGSDHTLQNVPFT